MRDALLSPSGVSSKSWQALLALAAARVVPAILRKGSAPVSL